MDCSLSGKWSCEYNIFLWTHQDCAQQHKSYRLELCIVSEVSIFLRKPISVQKNGSDIIIGNITSLKLKKTQIIPNNTLIILSNKLLAISLTILLCYSIIQLICLLEAFLEILGQSLIWRTDLYYNLITLRFLVLHPLLSLEDTDCIFSSFLD